jgi:hypothetical protein
VDCAAVAAADESAIKGCDCWAVPLPHVVNNAHSVASQMPDGILFTVTFEFDFAFIQRAP